ncbi:hypothetical protein ABIW71_003107 [Escherichia coli]
MKCKSVSKKSPRYTPAGHVLRVSLVDRECQKVICEPLGRNYRVSMPLIAFRSGKNMKHLGGAA